MDVSQNNDKALDQWFVEAIERIKSATGARTQVQLAEVLDVRQSSISDAKRRSSIPADWYLKLYRTYGLDPNWIKDGTEPVYIHPQKGRVTANELLKEPSAAYGKPLSRGKVASYSTLAGEDKEAETWTAAPTGEINIPESFSSPNLQVLYIDNASMEPIISRGAFVGIDTKTPVPDGDLCAIYFQHQGILIRRMFFENQNVILKAESNAHQDLQIPATDMAKRCIGRVIWVFHKVTDL